MIGGISICEQSSLLFRLTSKADCVRYSHAVQDILNKTYMIMLGGRYTLKCKTDIQDIL